MKFGLITDAHFGPAPMYFGENRIMSAAAPQVMSYVIEELNREPDLSFVVQLGDLIQEDVDNPDTSEDRESYQRALELLSNLNSPLYHVIGNHEPATLTKNEIKEIISYPELYYSFDADGYTGIVLYSDTLNHQNMRVSDRQLAWMSQELTKAEKHVLVFIHHQLAYHDISDHYWFRGRPEKAFVQNADEVMQQFKQSGKVLAVFNGHMHHNNMVSLGGIPYVTIQSMVENYDMKGEPSKAYAIIEVTDDILGVDVRGNNPVCFSIPHGNTL